MSLVARYLRPVLAESSLNQMKQTVMSQELPKAKKVIRIIRKSGRMKTTNCSLLIASNGLHPKYVIRLIQSLCNARSRLMLLIISQGSLGISMGRILANGRCQDSLVFDYKFRCCSCVSDRWAFEIL